MKRVFKIAMVAACPYPTGQGTQALIGELARGLSARGHDIHLVSYAHATQRQSEPFTIHRTAKLPGYNRARSGPDLAKPILDLTMIKTTLRVIREHGCHIIHAHNYEGLLVGAVAAKLSGVPLVYHAHNWMQDELPSYFHHKVSVAIGRVMGIALDRLLPRMADSVIALHRTMAEKIETFGVSRDKIKIIEPGINAAPWMNPSSGRKQNIVIYAGNLDSYQNLELAFASLSIVKREIPSMRFIIATPNDTGDAKKLAEKHGASGWCEVLYAPNAPKTAREYRRSKVAVCPRISPSGFPIKLLNAMAARVPVVACKAATGVLPLGTCLEIVDCNPESMAKAVVKLLIISSHRSMLADAARAMLVTRYSSERMCKEVEKTWESVL